MRSVHSMTGDSDVRALCVVAVVALAVVVVVPRHAQGRAIALISAVASLAWLYTSHPVPARCSGDDTSRVKKTPSESPPPFAPLDPELYTLRVPYTPQAKAAWIASSDDGAARSQLRNLSLRSRGLLVAVRKAARLGSRNGNSASGVRAMAALEDFFSRYHRAVLSSDADFAARTLDTLRDTRVVALNALNDVFLTVPAPLGGRVLRAMDTARDETLRCMSTLVSRHAASGSPTMAAASARWGSPSPHDPGGVVGRPDSLF
jgi:hypothetical protein